MLHQIQTISAPNGTQPVWSFIQTLPEGTTAKVSIAFGPGMPASLTLLIVPDVSVPSALLPCPSLRNEPCRAYPAFCERRLLMATSLREAAFAKRLPMARDTRAQGQAVDHVN